MFKTIFVALFYLCFGLQNDDILLEKTAIQIKLFSGESFLWHRKSVYIQSYIVQYQNGYQFWSNDGVLYSKLILDNSKFVEQPLRGVSYDEQEFVTFWLNTTSPENTVLKFFC